MTTKAKRRRYSNFSISKLFGKPLAEVDDILASKESHLKEITIPKKDGTPRHIIVPDGFLKWLQKSVYWRILKRYRAHNAAHGFVVGRGISTNAEPHVGAMSIGKIDVSNFFDSITEDHLKNCLFGNKHICRYCRHYEKMMDGCCNPSLYKNKNKNFEHKCEEIKAVFIPNFCEETGYDSLFLRIIKTCTNKGFTAQGFPTSPMLANIVLRGFDKSMTAFCEERDIIYTRYADDLAFSSKTLKKKELKKAVKKKAYSLLWAYNFKPNRKKTTFKSRAGRMKICGVVVNDVKNVQRSLVQLFRAKVHHAITMYPHKTTKKRIRQLKGWASYLMSINPAKGQKYMDRLLAFEKVKFKKK